MDRPSSCLMAAVWLCCAAQASAASTAQLAVQGFITPSACTPSLSDGGNIDHGKVTVKDLHPQKPTALSHGLLSLEVVCEGPTFFALSTIDNRAGTAALNPAHHGLGAIHDNQLLGNAAFGLLSPIADNAAVRTIISTDAGRTWRESIGLGHRTLTAFAAMSGPVQPIALRQLNAEVRVFTTIVPSSELIVTDEIPIDGDATVEMKYL